MIGVGDEAPRFEATTHDGKPVRIGADMERTVVLYFYPKDETYGCTVEACGFRDAYADFTDAGAAVIGVSQDDDASHRAFAENHDLPFALVSDADGELQRRYGVKRTLGLLPGRKTFVIDRKGIVRHAFSSQIRAGKHVAEALEIVRGLG